MPTRHSSLKSNNCNALSPARQGLTRLPGPLGQGDVLAGPVSVARVRPRTSKGITAYSTSRRRRRPPRTSTYRVLLRELGYPKGLARTLSCGVRTPTAHPFARVATARRDPSSPQDRPRRRSLYQVVLPASHPRAEGPGVSSPDNRGLPQRRFNAGLAEFRALLLQACVG